MRSLAYLRGVWKHTMGNHFKGVIMSPWEIIGWTIAIPMLLLTTLFVFALLTAVVKQIVKPRKTTANKPRLRLVDDE